MPLVLLPADDRVKIDVDQMLDHLSEVSIFDHSVFALFVIFGVSAAITLVHTLEEWKAPGGPLWWNFGAIVGVRIPDFLGFLLFTVLLTFALWLVSLVAITGNLVIFSVGTKYSAVALGALIGARLGDTLVSHFLLYVLGYRPNPGLSSTPLYIFEAGFLIMTFLKGITAGCGFTCLGLGIGVFAFCIVLPILWFLKIFKTGWRMSRWLPGQPLPTRTA
jgi:hypothetical protein